MIVKKGKITYPKSEALVVPANKFGIMSKGRALEIVQDGGKNIERASKKYLERNKLEVGDCFVIDSGRLKRRKVKNLYNCIIKRLPSDYINVIDVKNALDTALKKAILHGVKTITVCGLGIEDGELEKEVASMAIVDVCRRYHKRINIKIIDDDKEFITRIKNYIKKVEKE